MKHRALHRSLLIGALCAGTFGSPHAQEPIRFPDLQASYLTTGDFVGPDHVLRVRPGMSKDQIRLEVGSPHFSEGLFGVSEWDYAFNFYTGKGKDHVTCQYKVIFDKDYRAQSIHWKSAACEDLLTPPKADLRGALEPAVHCEQEADSQQVACLAPDRRVELIVHSAH